MKFEMTNFRAIAESFAAEGEVCDLPQAKLWLQAETDKEPGPLIEKVGTASMAQIDLLMAELRAAKVYLQSEKQRVEREIVRYTSLAQISSAMAEIISDAVSQWHPARNQPKAAEVKTASNEADIAIPASAPKEAP
jgi:hypothetical protein